MAAERIVIGGDVKGGVIISNDNVKLPEGTRVDIAQSLANVSPELQAEFAAWERASDEAWAMIDSWENEAQA